MTNASEQDRYFLLNIKHTHQWEAGRSAARSWLDNRAQAPIFYADTTIAQLREGAWRATGSRRANEPEAFVTLLDDLALPPPTLVTIDDGWIWIYEPYGSPKEGDAFAVSGRDALELPKYYDVRILRSCSTMEAPHVLGSLRCNRWISSGTFMPLDHERYHGNVQAIRYLLGRPLSPVSRLDCLSSVEFETLVAKLFEELGFFVPAYRGGMLAGLDLVAYDVGGVQPAARGLLPPLHPRQGWAGYEIQVKTRVASQKKEVTAWLTERADRLLATLETDFGKACRDRVLSRDWFHSALAVCPATSAWLRLSTVWATSAVD